MAYKTEFEFFLNVEKNLKKTRKNIITQYRPFNNLRLTVDIKSQFKGIEEWRELKIIEYKGKGRSLQNLWKGIGKVKIMQRLTNKLGTDSKLDIMNILTIPELDFNSLHNEIKEMVISMVPFEIFTHIGSLELLYDKEL